MPAVVDSNHSGMSSRPVKFPKGLPGFEEFTDWTLSPLEGEVFLQLASINDSRVALLLINPFVFFPDYEFELSDADAQELEIHNLNDFWVFSTVTVGKKAAECTANLVGPIVINRHTFAGRQVILYSRQYHTKHRIFQKR